MLSAMRKIDRYSGLESIQDEVSFTMYVFTILFTHALIYLPKALAEAKKLFAFP